MGSSYQTLQLDGSGQTIDGSVRMIDLPARMIDLLVRKIDGSGVLIGHTACSGT
jgi:hypothetical protein